MAKYNYIRNHDPVSGSVSINLDRIVISVGQKNIELTDGELAIVSKLGVFEKVPESASKPKNEPYVLDGSESEWNSASKSNTNKEVKNEK